MIYDTEKIEFMLFLNPGLLKLKLNFELELAKLVNYQEFNIWYTYIKYF